MTALMPPPKSSTLSLSFAALIECANQDAELKPAQRKNMACALRTVAKALGKDPALLDAMPATINARLGTFSPAMIKISGKSWANALSLTRAAFSRYGITGSSGRRRKPCAPQWTALLSMIPGKERLKLARLARFCTDQHITPDEVNDAVFDRLLVELTTNAIIKLPKKLHRRMAKLWNTMASTTRNWPHQAVSVPSYSRVYALEWKDFPASLQADVEAYLEFRRGSDPFAELDARPWKPRTVQTRRHELAAYLSALVLEGEKLETLTSLTVALTTPRVRKALEFFIRRSDQEEKRQAYVIARTVVGVARHWTKPSETEVKELSRFCSRLNPKAAGMGEDSRTRLRQFDDDANLQLLLTLPSKLTRSVHMRAKPTQQQALLFQSAVAIEILTMVPIRRANLAGLCIGETLLLHDDGAVEINIPGSQVKNGVPITHRLSAATSSMIRRYLKLYRPVLAAAGNGWLFPGVAERPKSCERLASQISDTIKEHTGLLMNVHLFRHLAATLKLRQTPGSYGSVRFLLGHKSIETTARFYCGQEARVEHDHYDAHIVRMREGWKEPPAKRSTR